MGEFYRKSWFGALDFNYLEKCEHDMENEQKAKEGKHERFK